MQNVLIIEIIATSVAEMGFPINVKHSLSECWTHFPERTVWLCLSSLGKKSISNYNKDKSKVKVGFAWP